jgi:acetyl-CoA C-acetyltransferase
MSQVPMGSKLGKGVGKAIPKSYFGLHEYTTQRAARAWDEGRFDAQIVPVDAPDLGDDGNITAAPPTGTTHRVGLRPTCWPATA